MNDFAIFDEFDKSFNLDELQAEVESAGKTEFKEVPHGDYEVAVKKIALGKSKSKGTPQAQIWFKVVSDGEFKNQMIFMYQDMSTPYGIRNVNDFLRSLETGLDIKFTSFTNYAGLMEEVFNAIDGVAEYHLAYGTNEKGFNTYNIIKRFNVGQ